MSEPYGVLVLTAVVDADCDHVQDDHGMYLYAEGKIGPFWWVSGDLQTLKPALEQFTLSAGWSIAEEDEVSDWQIEIRNGTPHPQVGIVLCDVLSGEEQSVYDGKEHTLFVTETDPPRFFWVFDGEGRAWQGFVALAKGWRRGSRRLTLYNYD